jgi:hypothetical protein
VLGLTPEEIADVELPHQLAAVLVAEVVPRSFE